MDASEHANIPCQDVKQAGVRWAVCAGGLLKKGNGMYQVRGAASGASQATQCTQPRRGQAL